MKQLLMLVLSAALFAQSPETTTLHRSTVLPYDHYMTHSGRHFTVSSRVEVQGSGTVQDWLVIAEGKYIHISWSWSGNAEFSVQIFEAPDASGGTSLTLHNNRRDHSGTLMTEVKISPSVNSPGLLLWEDIIGSGGNTPGRVKSCIEFILKPGESYLWRATKATGQKDDVVLRLNVYETTRNEL